MNRPKVFISSTIKDLYHVRNAVEKFVKSMHYQPVLSEKRGIGYSPGKSAEDSCPNAVLGCDLFVLIIGEVYPTKPNEEINVSGENKVFEERYTSVAEREFDAAWGGYLPIYVFVENSVAVGYEKYRNALGERLENVFKFIDRIRTKPRDNAFYPYTSSDDIEKELIERWGDLFYELLNKRLDIKKSESEMSNNGQNRSSQLAFDLNKRIKKFLDSEILQKVPAIAALSSFTSIDRKTIVYEVYAARNFDDFHSRILRSYDPECKLTLLETNKFEQYWINASYLAELNEIRSFFELKLFEFKKP